LERVAGNREERHRVTPDELCSLAWLAKPLVPVKYVATATVAVRETGVSFSSTTLSRAPFPVLSTNRHREIA